MDNLKVDLDKLYTEFSTHSFIESDPIKFVHRYSFPLDQEVVGLLSSCLAFGRRDKINLFIKKLLSYLGDSPYNTVMNFDKGDLDIIKPLVYRFIKGEDIIRLLHALKLAFREYNSLEGLFNLYFRDNSIRSAIIGFTRFFHGVNHNGLSDRERNYRFLLPSPLSGSACKRINLFLRWMIRKDKVDIGLWDSIDKRHLLIPVDTHVARVSKLLGLTNRKSADWKMAEEITDKLRVFDFDDPVKYDFALFGYGLNVL